MTEAQALAFIENALTSLYQKAIDGKDVSPAQRLRLEGQVDLLIEMGLIDRQQFMALLDKTFEEMLGQSMETSFRQWATELDYTVIPFYMQEAPVYKGHGS